MDFLGRACSNRAHMQKKSQQKQAFHVVINAKAGTVLRLGQNVIEEKIKASGLPLAGLHFPEPEQLEETLLRLQAAPESIILGGGDGTIAGAVTHFLDKSEAMGIIPMGTMNLLARDVGMPVELDEVLAAYAGNTRTVRIDVGLVNGKPFLCCAALGVMPEAAEFREENRGSPDLILIPQLAMFVFQHMERQRRLRVALDGKMRAIRTSALIISNNPFTDEDATGEADALRKDTLQGGKLGVYTVVPRSFAERIRLLLRLKIGGWKKENSIVERLARHIRVYTRLKEEKITLDGEIFTLSTPLEFRVKPRALQLIIPERKILAAGGA